MNPDRRSLVPFDARHFEKIGGAASRDERFREIFRRNHWAGAESVSGEGAGREQTRGIEEALPAILQDLGVRSLLDLPCGDFAWMQHVDLPGVQYIGGDLLPELIAENRRRHQTEHRAFRVIDLLSDPLPRADLILCRDCLVHLSFGDIACAIQNMKRSPITYLLTTTFPECEANEEITTGDWRPINLQGAPFGFPAPALLLNEGCTEGGGAFRDKSLGLWRIDRLPTLR